MNFLNKFHISLSGNPYLFLIGFILILFYTIFIYRITIPDIGKYNKILLVTLRTIALSIMLFLLFEPVIKIKKKTEIEPTNLIFIDNSKSISEYTKRNEIFGIKNLAKQFFNSVQGNNKLFSFGEKINEISIRQVDSLKFNESFTKLNSIFNYVDKYKNVSSVTIISDGIINTGNNPFPKLEKLNVPICTVIVGDTSNTNDIEINSIRSNEYIYPNRQTEIEVTITNTGYAGKTATLKFSEGNKILDSKKIILSKTGINRIPFDYTGNTIGKHKLTVSVFSKEKEKNKRNNIKSIIINVLNTKKKILLISGSASNDLSAIKSALQNNDDLKMESIIKLSAHKFYLHKNNFEKIKEADLLILINFPSVNTNSKNITKVKRAIKIFHKPYLLCFSNNTDFNKLSQLNEILPFSLSSKNNFFFNSTVKPANFSVTNNLLGSTEQIKEEWSNLPPVSIVATSITPDINSEILLVSNSKIEIPVIFSNNSNNIKSIIINAANVWKLKLKATNKYLKLFDNFILNSIKWLSLENDNQKFKLKPEKQNYKLGETITFTASLYDETFNPVINANIRLEISHNNKFKFFNLKPLGEGIYESKITLNKPGTYTYKGKVISKNKPVKTIEGKFYISPIELELFTSKANIYLLKSTAYKTGGNFFNLSTYKKLFDYLNKKYKSDIKYEYTDNKLHLSFLDFILLIVVFVLSVEWLIRKLLRML